MANTSVLLGIGLMFSPFLCTYQSKLFHKAELKFLCVGLDMCACACWFIFVYIWRPNLSLSIYLQELSFEHRVPLNMNFIDLAGVAGQ